MRSRTARAVILTPRTEQQFPGLLVAVGPAAAFVGLQSCVAVLIAAGFPQTFPEQSSPQQSSLPAERSRRFWSSRFGRFVGSAWSDRRSQPRTVLWVPVGGTIPGGGVATLLVTELHPGSTGLTFLVLAFVWICYATFRVNYTLFTVAITGYVVFILMLSGVGEMAAVTLRALDTIAGGCIALVVYAVCPTWAGFSVRSALAAMFEAQSCSSAICSARTPIRRPPTLLA